VQTWEEKKVQEEGQKVGGGGESCKVVGQGHKVMGKMCSGSGCEETDAWFQTGRNSEVGKL
jgi:hypothetical protein